MDKEILLVIRYFDQFDYPPTDEEVYAFISRKITLSLLDKRLDLLCRKKKLAKGQMASNFNRFSFYHRQNLFALQKKKEKISQKKIKKVSLYLKLLSFFSQIKLVGLSGSLAMMNASKNDDIDLFIITARDRLFTGRFIAVVIGYLLDVRRKPPYSINNQQLTINNRDKVCLNLFFDEKKLLVPRNKMTSYVAHEILQMKPIINKSQTYERFLKANLWVKKIFPNTEKKISIFNSQFSINFQFLNWLGNYMERLLKNLQLYFINHHRTTEIVTSSQLWFHPADFGKQIKDR